MQFADRQVVSEDGTRIGYRQIGIGPGLVILHGGMRASQHYTRLAEALADTYTVTIYDRRGRGMSGPHGEDYNIEKEMADLRAVMEKTSARQVFGHSAGGFFALEAALRLPIQKLLLYEPAVSIHGSIDFGWLPVCEQALARHDPGAAFIQLFKGLRLHWSSRLPAWLFQPMVRQMMRSEEGREIAELLPTGVREAKEMQHLEAAGQTFERYQKIGAATLLVSGSKSPAYLRNAARTLAQTIPGASVVELAGLDHNAPDQNNPHVVAGELRRFLSKKGCRLAYPVRS
jgi:pimeloyl-ACP methyl ester carboxylesterase